MKKLINILISHIFLQIFNVNNCRILIVFYSCNMVILLYTVYLYTVSHFNYQLQISRNKRLFENYVSNKSAYLIIMFQIPDINYVI